MPRTATGRICACRRSSSERHPSVARLAAALPRPAAAPRRSAAIARTPQEPVMNPSDPVTWTIADARAALDGRALSAVELARAVLARVAAVEPSLHALLEVTS